MHLYPMGHVPPKPSKHPRPTEHGTSTASSRSCGITLWRWKALFGNAVNPRIELLSQFKWSAACLAGPISCWENIGVRPSPSARGRKSLAALSGDESDIGIDVAGVDEFQREYPFHRVFHAQELQHALRLAGGDLEQASPCSGLSRKPWSRPWMCIPSRDPRQITVYPSVGGRQGARRVYLSGGLIREGSGAVSHAYRPVLMGTFAS